MTQINEEIRRAAQPIWSLILCMLFAWPFSGCATTETDEGAWVFTETDDQSESSMPDDVAGAVGGENENVIISPYDALDCSQVDLNEWESDEFAFVLYRYFSCQRSAEENMVYSPAALRISLAQRANDLGGVEGQLIARQMGFDSIEQFFTESMAYRDELLERRPLPGTRPMGNRLYDYWIEEDDEDRLLEALGLEFFSPSCSQDATGCRWVPENERWSQSNLDDESLTASEMDRMRSSTSMVLRGQWESPRVSYPGIRPIRDFHLSTERVLSHPTLRGSVDAEMRTEFVSLFQFRLVGSEISFFVLASSNLSFGHLEGALSPDHLSEWMGALQRSSPTIATRVFFPDFDIRQTVDITGLLDLQNGLENRTRLAIDDEGLNFPNPVELLTDWSGTASTLGYVYDIFFADRPFIFFVYDHPTESILLMGRIVDPSATD